MASGGARPRSGPAPDPNALRRDRGSDADGWVTLPADGRVGSAPEWPLPGQTTREHEVWSAMWLKPQAIEWERLGQEHYVALYVRRMTEAELPGSLVAISTLVRQMSDELGITSAGLNRNRWKIGTVAPAIVDATPDRVTASSRLTMVPGGAA